mgnify:FL=1|tara:strand:- start:5323 stop:6075 length:753 start_codon:yes stop_codon:yes gene_type:complete
MFNYIVWIIKKIYYKLSRFDTHDGTYAYRKYLFKELCEIYGDDFFVNKRIMEIGPKDGEDTFRLESLRPSEIVLFDLPDKTEENNKWINQIKIKNKLIAENFLYLDKEKYNDLENFDLIYFTGVLYHNPEQLKFIKKLYDKLNPKGVLVLESATTRNPLLKNKNVVEIWFPETYRNTTTITHLPSKKAIISWLKMVGFRNIFISKAYNPEDYNVRGSRLACIAQKLESDNPSVYYEKQIENSNYVIGGST